MAEVSNGMMKHLSWIVPGVGVFIAFVGQFVFAVWWISSQSSKLEWLTDRVSHTEARIETSEKMLDLEGRGLARIEETIKHLEDSFGSIKTDSRQVIEHLVAIEDSLFKRNHNGRK